MRLPTPPIGYDQRTENVRNREIENEDSRNAKRNTEVSFANVHVARSTNAIGDEVVTGLDSRLGITGGTVTSVNYTAPAEFTVIITNPTTAASIAMTWASQATRVFLASPAFGAGIPSFRAITTSDLPITVGTVQSFSSGNLPGGLGTASVVTATTTPALTFTAVSQTAKFFYAAPNGGAGNPSFRAIVTSDLPATVGTVQSVALNLPATLFSISGSPVTTTGTLTGTLTTQSANAFWSGPISGAATAPTFRVMDLLDMPNTTDRIFYALTTPPAAIANTATETAFAFAAPTLSSIPANTLRVGSVLRVSAWGIYSTTALSPTLRFRLKLGGVTLIDSQSVAGLLNSASNAGWHMNALLTVTAIGAGGAFECAGVTEYGAATAATQRFLNPNTAPISLSTTGALAPSITAQWSAAAAANTATCRQFVIEIFK